MLDSQQDTVIEYSSEGVDTVWVPFSYSVANLPYVETVRGFGVVNIWLIGNAGANTISGSTGSDIIDGGASTDTALYYGNRTNYTISKVSAGCLNSTLPSTFSVIGEPWLNEINELRWFLC